MTGAGEAAVTVRRMKHPVLRKAADFRIAAAPSFGEVHRAAIGGSVDYRLQEVTAGRIRAFGTLPGNFVDKPRFASPWHFHDCTMQIAVVLDGSVELGYREGQHARAQKGDVLFIPGQEVHDVGMLSSDYQILEITFPGTFATVEAPPPPRDLAPVATTLSPRDAPRVGTKAGVLTYRFPVPAPYADTYAVYRHVRSRTDEFQPGVHEHAEDTRITIPAEGWMDVEIDGVRQRMERGDLLLHPPGVSLCEHAASDDWVAVEIRVRDGR